MLLLKMNNSVLWIMDEEKDTNEVWNWWIIIDKCSNCNLPSVHDDFINHCYLIECLSGWNLDWKINIITLITNDLKRSSIVHISRVTIQLDFCSCEIDLDFVCSTVRSIFFQKEETSTDNQSNDDSMNCALRMITFNIR